MTDNNGMAMALNVAIEKLSALEGHEDYVRSLALLLEIVTTLKITTIGFASGKVLLMLDDSTRQLRAAEVPGK